MVAVLGARSFLQEPGLGAGLVAQRETRPEVGVPLPAGPGLGLVSVRDAPVLMDARLSRYVINHSELAGPNVHGMLPYVSRLSGVMLVVVGLYVAYYGWFEIRVYSTAGGLKDPVIAAAARIQTVLAGWVYANGPWPWAAGVAVIVAVVVTATALTRCRRAGTRRRSSELKSAI